MGQLRNPHPGEILKEEFLNEIGVSQNHITADTDLRLCKFFGLAEGYFLRL
jgi:antitoxin HigA-1